MNLHNKEVSRMATKKTDGGDLLSQLQAVAQGDPELLKQEEELKAQLAALAEAQKAKEVEALQGLLEVEGLDQVVCKLVEHLPKDQVAAIAISSMANLTGRDLAGAVQQGLGVLQGDNRAQLDLVVAPFAKDLGWTRGAGIKYHFALKSDPSKQVDVVDEKGNPMGFGRLPSKTDAGEYKLGQQTWEKPLQQAGVKPEDLVLVEGDKVRAEKLVYSD